MGEGIYPLGFARTNLGASLTDSPLEAGVGGGLDHLVAFDGEVCAAGVDSNAARTAGTATFEVLINGSKLVQPTVPATEGTVRPVLDATNPQRHGTRIAYGARPRYPVKRGDVVSAVVTTDAAWAPTTADVNLDVWLTRGGYEP